MERVLEGCLHFGAQEKVCKEVRHKARGSKELAKMNLSPCFTYRGQAESISRAGTAQREKQKQLERLE